MKRTILTTFATVALIGVTAACAKKNDTAMTDTAVTSQTTTTTTQTTPPPPDTSHQPAATSQPSATQSEVAPPPPPEAPEQKPTKVIKHKDTTITPTGLKYIDKKIGKGPSPKKPDQTVVVNYTGMLTNGKAFDSNVDPLFGHLQPFQTKLNQVIPGWTEGIMTMKAGGKRRLIIPPDLGYGARGMGDRIPPNATLIFDVELLDVQP